MSSSTTHLSRRSDPATSHAAKAPFPWFGGKADVAAEVWSRFGDVRGYVEPFAGSLAVLLGRPQPFSGVETVNDLDGLLSNAWRAIRDKPEETAIYAAKPVSECDCHAEEVWLLERKEDITAQLEADPDYCDPKAAGRWLHGICCWIGSGFCDGKGPWQAIDGKLVDTRQRPHLSDAGRGVNRKLPHLSNAGQGDEPQATRVEMVSEYLSQLAERLDRVRICCGDWRRVCGGNKGDSLKHFFACGQPCAVVVLRLRGSVVDEVGWPW